MKLINPIQKYPYIIVRVILEPLIDEIPFLIF